MTAPRTGYYIRAKDAHSGWKNLDIAELTDQQRADFIMACTHNHELALRWLDVTIRLLREVWDVIEQENYTEEEPQDE